MMRSGHPAIVDDATMAIYINQLLTIIDLTGLTTTHHDIIKVFDPTNHH
jgi:hypothetical protein